MGDAVNVQELFLLCVSEQAEWHQAPLLYSWKWKGNLVRSAWRHARRLLCKEGRVVAVTFFVHVSSTSFIFGGGLFVKSAATF